MARKISVEIVGDASSLERAFKKSSKAAKAFQGDMQKTGRRSVFGGVGKLAGLAAGTAGLAGLATVAKSAFAEFENAQQVTAQTNAALKSTGQVANVTAKHVDQLANAMLNKTGIDDEATKTAENMLLTFTNVRNEAGKGNKIFDRATGAVADLATAMNRGMVPSAEQMQKASIQLGKALNDPIKGVGALARIGIQFTKQQKTQIKALVDSGHVMQAQKVILAELGKEVGGRAAAAGKTFSGQWRILTETLDNLSGDLAAKLMPTIQKYLQLAVKWLSNSRNQKQILDSVQAAVSAVESVVRVLAGAFRVLNKVTGSTTNTFKVLLAAFVAFKALKLVAYIAGMTKAMRAYAAASAMAGGGGFGGGAGGGAGGGRFGKALGAAGAVVVGAPLVAAAVRKIPGWDNAMKGFGGKLFDVTHPGSGAISIQGGLHVHGVQNTRQLENELQKRMRGRPHRRRGS